MIEKTEQPNEEFLFEIAITGEGRAFIWATDQTDAREQTDRLFGDWAKKATISLAREVRAVMERIDITDGDGDVTVGATTEPLDTD